MRDRKFGWSYPPGCSGPPEEPDPHPKSEEIYDLLEKAGCSQDVIDAACEIVEELAGLAERECPHCEQRAAEEFRKSEQEFSEIERLQADLTASRQEIEGVRELINTMRQAADANAETFDRAYKRAESAEKQLAELQAAYTVVTDRLRWVLPLAKGYAANNPVGSNQRYCELAEECLSDQPKSVLNLLAVVEAAKALVVYFKTPGIQFDDMKPGGHKMKLVEAVRKLTEDK